MSKPTPVEAGRRAIPARRNLALFLILGASQSVLLLLPPLAGWSGWLVFLPLMLTTSYWALLHEAVHGLLFPDSRASALGGRWLAVPFGSPFALLRAGHLLHHKFSRTADVSEAQQPGEPPAYAAFRHYGTILGGLYVSEVLGGMAMFLPVAARDALFRRFLPANALGERFQAWLRRPEVVREARLDSVFVIAWIGLVAYVWRDAWGWLLLAFGGRGLLISFFDNAYHYGTAVGDPWLARNHRMPGWASAAILHFNLHGTHHRFPALPWSALPAAASAEGVAADGGYLSRALQQLRGPIAIATLPVSGQDQSLRPTKR